MEKDKSKSLYETISSAVVDGELPNDFSLPKNTDGKNEIAWADGAMDGVGIYHMGFSDMSEEDHDLMAEAVKAAAKGNYDSADALFVGLGKKTSAIFVIDPLQSYIIDNKDRLNAGNVFQYAVHAVVDSTDRECLKFGLSLLELFDTDSNEKLKDIIRTVGLSDEFTIFSVFVMLRWDDGNNEVFEIAKKVHGWGRIHVVERIEPGTDEIREWMLTEGVHNWVMPAYSALTCWQKSNAEEVLKRSLSDDEFRGLGDIINGLLDEGPVSGISEIENAEEKITAYLNQAEALASTLDDYEVIRSIRLHYEDEDSADPEIVALCQTILETEKCKKVVTEALKTGKGIGLARDLNMDYKEAIFRVMTDNFEEKYHLCHFLCDDLEFRERVIDVFRQKLPLSEMKTEPTKTLGLGKDFWKQSAVESLLQELRNYLPEGLDFVETALQSAPIRTRNFGISALENWVSEKGVPLSELFPEFKELLSKLVEIEPDDRVKKDMERLLSGAVTFENNEAEDDDEK